MSSISAEKNPGKGQTGMSEKMGSRPDAERRGGRERKSILIYSQDLSFCFSLASLFQDRYAVITSTDPELLESVHAIRSAGLVIVDDDPSDRMVELIREMKEARNDLPVMMLYVFSPRGRDLDRAVKEYVDAVFYKPLNVQEMSRSIEELIGG